MLKYPTKAGVGGGGSADALGGVDGRYTLPSMLHAAQNLIGICEYVTSLWGGAFWKCSS